jgi:hypothetical protein
MKRIFITLVTLLICCTQNAHAIRIKKTPDCVMVHETAGENTIRNFVEDVLFLLPTELSDLLANNYDELYSSAKFALPPNYWQHKVLDESELKQLFYSTARDYKKNNSEVVLTRALGRTVENIIQIAMVSNGFDPLKEQVRSNVSDFLSTTHSRTYLISQDPYQNHSFDSEIEKLYALRKYRKQDLYPELVKSTANLWTSVWVATGHSATIVPQYFYRRPFQLVGQMKPWREVTDDKGGLGGLRDQREMMIVLRNLDRDPYEIESQIVSKRIQDNVRAARKQQEADSEYKRFKQNRGIKDELIVIDTDDMAAAIKRQRIAQGNSDDFIVIDDKTLRAETAKCDSLERCFLR